jgi:hypothetical protein
MRCGWTATGATLDRGFLRSAAAPRPKAHGQGVAGRRMVVLHRAHRRLSERAPLKASMVKLETL